MSVHINAPYISKEYSKSESVIGMTSKTEINIKLTSDLYTIDSRNQAPNLHITNHDCTWLSWIHRFFLAAPPEAQKSEFDAPFANNAAPPKCFPLSKMLPRPSISPPRPPHPPNYDMVIIVRLFTNWANSDLINCAPSSPPPTKKYCHPVKKYCHPYLLPP